MNALVCRNLARAHAEHQGVAGYSLSVETVDYALLSAADQHAALRRLGYNWLLPVPAWLRAWWSGSDDIAAPTIPLPGYSWTNVLRVLPFRYLHQGLAFWGDADYRERIYRELAAAINRLAAGGSGESTAAVPDSTDDMEEHYLVAIGFSMGATIVIEFMNDYARELARIRQSSSKSHDNLGRRQHTDSLYDAPHDNAHRPVIAIMPLLSARGRRLLSANLLQLVTVGCALNWHHPLRPSSRTYYFNLPWLNIHYHDDVLSSALRHQMEVVGAVEDLEVWPVHPMRSKLLAFAGQRRPSFGHGATSSASRTFPQRPWTIFGQLVELADGVYTLVVDGLVAIARLTPACHMFYFHDRVVLDAILRAIDESLETSRKVRRREIVSLVDSVAILATPKSRAQSIWATPPSSMSDLLAEDALAEEAVQCCLVQTSEGSRAAAASLKAPRFAFVYVHGMSTDDLAQNEINSFVQHLQHVVTSDSNMMTTAYDVHALTYHHIVERSRDQRMRANAFSGLWDTVKHIILKRFPVALAYWSEPLIRRVVHRGIHDHLAGLVRTYEERGEKDVCIVMVGYATGGMVTALALGDLYREFGRLLPVKSEHVRLHALVTLGCPLPWYQEDVVIVCAQVYPNVYHFTDVSSLGSAT